MQKETYHTQAKLRVANKTIHVDTKMKDLIQVLNKAGLKTLFSCQGGTIEGKYAGKRYISFNMKDVEISVTDEKFAIYW